MSDTITSPLVAIAPPAKPESSRRLSDAESSTDFRDELTRARDETSGHSAATTERTNRSSDTAGKSESDTPAREADRSAPTDRQPATREEQNDEEATAAVAASDDGEEQPTGDELVVVTTTIDVAEPISEEAQTDELTIEVLAIAGENDETAQEKPETFVTEDIELAAPEETGVLPTDVVPQATDLAASTAETTASTNAEVEAVADETAAETSPSAIATEGSAKVDSNTTSATDPSQSNLQNSEAETVELQADAQKIVETTATPVAAVGSSKTEAREERSVSNRAGTATTFTEATKSLEQEAGIPTQSAVNKSDAEVEIVVDNIDALKPERPSENSQNPETSLIDRASRLLQRTGESRTSQTENGPRVDASRFVNRVARAFQSAQDNGGTVRLRLSPPELGAMRIELSVQQGVLSARLETENPAARAVLLDNLPALRERLAEQQIRVDKFDVDVGGGQHDAGPEWQQAEEQNRRFANSIRPTGVIENNIEASDSDETTQTPNITDDGEFNAVA